MTFVDKTERMDRKAVFGGANAFPVAEMTEEQIHRATFDLLDRAAVPGSFAFHVPNGEKRGAGIGGKLKGMGTRAGMPDVCIIFRGRFYVIELKKRGGRVSPAQHATHALLIGCGAEVRTCYSLDEVIATLTEWGIIR